MTRALIPNSTQIPDVILDHWMAELSGAELKVLLYIARRTYGFGKERDTISLNQIAHGLIKRDGTVLDRGTGASRSSVARSVKVLEDIGIVLRKTNLGEKTGEYEENTYSINLEWEQPPNNGGNGSGKKTTSRGAESAEGVVSKSDYPPSNRDRGVVSNRDQGVSKSDGVWSQDETRVVSKWDIQETDLQETDQETASAGAAASLTEILIGHGVGRSTALRLVREKPDVCRRCLQYLPYAEFRTTKGAWLANAIRDEYGPPEGYERVRLETAKKERVRLTAERHNAHKTREDERRREKDAGLRERYLQMEKEQGEPFTAFNEHVRRERAKVLRIAVHLPGRRREELAKAFDTAERRLSLFDEWLKVGHHPEQSDHTDPVGPRPMVGSRGTPA